MRSASRESQGDRAVSTLSSSTPLHLPSALSSLDQLPSLDSAYDLRDGDIGAYRRDGHVVLRSLASQAEVAAYRPLLGRAVARYATEQRPLSERDTYGKAFLQIMNLWQRDELCRRFVFARRFARVAAELMGVDGVRLYHDQALFKEAGGGITPWHQDQYYWPLDTTHCITLWMPLVNVDASMGIMQFASGSHRHGYIGELEISDESEVRLGEIVRQRGLHVAGTDAMSAGDASFHSGWTLHRAPPNRSSRVREVMTVIYFADGTRVSAPDNPHRESDLRAWLVGLEPGDNASSALNPLLYSR